MMKKFLALFFLVTIITGCSSGKTEIVDSVFEIQDNQNVLKDKFGDLAEDLQEKKINFYFISDSFKDEIKKEANKIISDKDGENIIFLIDKEKKNLYISSKGRVAETLNEEFLNSVLNEQVEILQSGDYDIACARILQALNESIPEDFGVDSEA